MRRLVQIARFDVMIPKVEVPTAFNGPRGMLGVLVFWRSVGSQADGVVRRILKRGLVKTGSLGRALLLARVRASPVEQTPSALTSLFLEGPVHLRGAARKPCASDLSSPSGRPSLRPPSADQIPKPPLGAMVGALGRNRAPEGQSAPPGANFDGRRHSTHGVP